MSVPIEKSHGTWELLPSRNSCCLLSTVIISTFCVTYNRKPKLKEAKPRITAIIWTCEEFPQQPDGRALLCRTKMWEEGLLQGKRVLRGSSQSWHQDFILMWDEISSKVQVRPIQCITEPRAFPCSKSVSRHPLCYWVAQTILHCWLMFPLKTQEGFNLVPCLTKHLKGD